jgi:hypothetical protein
MNNGEESKLYSFLSPPKELSIYLIWLNSKEIDNSGQTEVYYTKLLK